MKAAVTQKNKEGGSQMMLRPCLPIVNYDLPLKPEDRSYFSDEKYECVSLFRTKHGVPVLLLESRDPARLCWKVQTGSIAMYFRNFSEANAYCKRHYYDLRGNRLQTI
jgi:hypothetical protein